MIELFEIINTVLPALSVIATVCVTIYTVNNRIKNENRENHKPYLFLESVEDIDKINIYSYYLVPIGRNYMEKYRNIDYEKKENDNDLTVALQIRNIGYGVASNIKFYNLLSGKQIHGTQESSKEQNQKLFTTFDIAASESKSIQAQILNLLKEEDGMIIEDHVRMLCVYQDLNNNIYDFIISINSKENSHYDFFTYQPSSRSYKKWIKQNKKEFKSIMKDYKS